MRVAPYTFKVSFKYQREYSGATWTSVICSTFGIYRSGFCTLSEETGAAEPQEQSVSNKRLKTATLAPWAE